MWKKWARIVSILVCGCILLSAAGCSGKQEAKTGNAKTVVKFSYWNTEETMEPLLKLLGERLDDITVEYNYVENQFYGTAVKTKLSAGEGDDIIAFGALDILSLSSQDKIMDLTEQYGSKYSSAGKAPYTIEGKLYAVPMLSWFEGVFYNKEIFSEQGLTAPKTFDEWLQVCDTLSAAGIKPMIMGAKDGSALLKSCLGYVTAQYLLDEGKDFDSQFAKGEAALAGTWDPYVTKWKMLIDKGYLTGDMLGMDEAQAMDEFVTGKAAMWASGPWNYNTMKQKNITLKFDMFPYPGDSPEKACLVGSPGAGFIINNDSEVKDAALKVMDVISSPEGQAALIEGNPGSSSYLVGVETELPDEYASVKETLDQGRVYCAWENWGLGTNSFNNFTQDLQGLVANRISVENLLKDVDQIAMSFIRGEN